jgi:hypothetical protein
MDSDFYAALRKEFFNSLLGGWFEFDRILPKDAYDSYTKLQLNGYLL